VEDTKKLLDNYRELEQNLPKLSPAGGQVSKELENLKDNLYKLIIEYDKDENNEIDDYE